MSDTAETWTAIRTCPLCEATCGLRLTMHEETVTRVEGDPDDVFSGGYLCPKGAALGELEHDPDRLRRPRVRDGRRWREAGWDEAFALVEERLAPLIDEHGADAVGVYLGNPNVHNLSGSLYVKPLLKSLGTRNIFTASTVDQMPKHVSCGLMFGDPLAIPVPDIDRTSHLLVLGANPRMSNGSLLTAPDLPGRLDALRERGARLVVVDPRRSRTAEAADEHVPIRPGTDGLLLAAIATTLLEERVAAPGAHLERHVAGLDRIENLLAGLTPEDVAPACRIPATTIRRLARDLAAADSAAVYGRIGTTTTTFGTVTSWLVDVCNILTGNLDDVGGAMFPRPGHVGLRRRGRPFRTGRWRSRVRGLPEVLGELPVATLADEIETPGEGRIRAVVTIAGNPVLSTPDSERLDAALAGLDLMISVDPYRNETTRHADVILPPPGALHRSHYDLAFYGLSVRNVANYSPPVLPLPEGMIHEWEILLRLAGIAVGEGAAVDVAAADDLVAHTVAQRAVSLEGSRIAGSDPDEIVAALSPRRGPDRLLDLLLRSGPYGDGFGEHPDGLSLAALEEAPHGIDLGPLKPRLPDNLSTASGRVELVPDAIVDEVARLRGLLDRHGGEEVVMVGRRHLRSNNSWMHNVKMLTKGRPLCTLQIHPDDALAHGLEDGGQARIRSVTGDVVAPVEVTDDIMPGVVSLPHGYGHDLEGVEMAVARERQPGVNSNVLTDADAVDPLSGTAELNGVAVSLEPA